jgi:hypothetical protein
MAARRALRAGPRIRHAFGTGRAARRTADPVACAAMAGLRRPGLLPTLTGALLGLGLFAGCAGDAALAGGRYVDPERRFAFSLPEPGEPPWRRIEVERTLVAWTRVGGARMSAQAECGRRPPSPQVLARSLLIGVGPRVLRQSGPVAVGEIQGWSQVLDVQEGERVVRLKSVTLVAGECTLDFLLVAGDDFEAAEPGFDAWWQSLEAPAPAAPEPRS